MDIMESLRILRRRWILTLIMFLVVLGGTAAAAYKLPRTYQSNSTVVLLASPNASKLNGGNPYLSFNSSLPLTADVVRRELMDPRTVQGLAKQGATATYLVAAATDTSGPVLLVTVTGPQKAAVEKTLYTVTTEIRVKLADLQQTVTPANQISVITLSIDPRATLSVSKLARPVVVLLGLGLIIAFAVPLIVDAQSTRRSRMKALPPPRPDKRVPAERLPSGRPDAERAASGERRRGSPAAGGPSPQRRPGPAAPDPSRRPRYSEPEPRSASGSRHPEPPARPAPRDPRYPEPHRDARHSEPARETRPAPSRAD